MPTKTNSKWRRKAREVIRFVLERLPYGASDEQKQKAISDAYPWGLREHHPYRMWLAEVKEALEKPAPPRPQPTIVDTDQGVTCGWCGFPKSPGCPLCYEKRKRWEQRKEEESCR